MEDFTEKLAKPHDSSDAPVFKRPVIIGKRPGGLKTTNSIAASTKSSDNAATAQTSENDTKKPLESVKTEKPENSPCESRKSPAEIEREKQVPLPYREPEWSEMCSEQYSMEVLKSGVIVSNLELRAKSFVVLGRLSGCDVILEHPSISRYHAVLQFGNKEENGDEKGWYLYDLGSTHGTFLNKQQLPPKSHIRIRAGHMFKLGVSTRMFILQGPPEDEEPESELTVTQLKELRLKREAQLDGILDSDDQDQERDEKPKKEEPPSEKEGIDWGMGEDAVDENPHADNPFALDADAVLNEDLYLEDPKKTLRGWFEREGYELEYKVEERGYANFVCRVELPIETPSAMSVVAEANVKCGKKKEAVVQCALEACRILDRHGLLRQSNHQAKHQRKKRFGAEDDYYSSDEDTFLDRTGAVERKRQARMKAAGKAVDSIETFESLTVKCRAVQEELEQVRQGLAEASATSSSAAADTDDLDVYMSALQAEASGKKKNTSVLKARLTELHREEARLQKLLKVAKPTMLPQVELPKTLQPLQPPEPQEEKKHHETPLEMVAEVAKVDGEPTPSREPVQPRAAVAPIEAAVKHSGKRKAPSLGPLLPPDLLKQLRDEARDEGDDVEAGKTSKSVDQSHEPTADGEEDEAAQAKAGLVIRKRKKSKSKSDSVKKTTREVPVEYDASDTSKYAMWVPPQDQSGDGKTLLNKKLGY